MSEKLRVVLAGQYPEDPGRIRGGVEAVVASLAGEMARRPDIDLHIVSGTTHTTAPKVERRPGMTLHWLPRRRFGRGTFHAREVLEMRRYIRRLAPDIVHAHGTGIYAGAAATLRPIPSVITVHGIIFREAGVARGVKERLGWEMDALFERWVLRSARHIIAISPYVERECEGRTQAVIHRIENPIPDAFFDIQGEGEQGRILFAGRVIRRKDPLTALRATALAHAEFPSVRLHIAGELDADPEYAGEALALARELGLDGVVHFLGQLEEEALRREYAACSIVLLTSVQETAPVVIEQAMAAGRPVVSTDAGGAAHLIEAGRTGFIVPIGDVQALAEKLLILLRRPETRRRMGEEARREALRRFKASAVVDNTLAVYRTILSGDQANREETECP